MNTKRNWVQVAVVVVMAVARLSFTAPVAADLCGVPFVSEFDQYMAATEWAEQGGPVPEALTVSCVEDSFDLTASLADLSVDSGVRWEQYMAAIEGNVVTHIDSERGEATEEYLAVLALFEPEDPFAHLQPTGRSGVSLELTRTDAERRKATEAYLAELALLEPEDPFAHLQPTGRSGVPSSLSSR